MYTSTRQTRVDYNLIHQYLQYINFNEKYERIYLVEPVNQSSFVIRLKFPRTNETYPIYVKNTDWQTFITWLSSQQQEKQK